MLKIRGKPVFFPIAVAGRLWAVAALQFLRLTGGFARACGPPCFGLGKRTRSGRVQRLLSTGGICGGIFGLRLGGRLG